MFIAIGIVLTLVGLALDVARAIVGVHGTGSLNYLGLAAIAQTLMIVGVNTALGGFITGIIEGVRYGNPGLKAGAAETGEAPALKPGFSMSPLLPYGNRSAPSSHVPHTPAAPETRR